MFSPPSQSVASRVRSACHRFASCHLTRAKRNHVAQRNNRTRCQQKETTLTATGTTMEVDVFGLCVGSPVCAP